MKTGELSAILNVTRDTIRSWVDNPLYAPLFSPGAKGQHGSPHRVFSESDVLVLNTIRHFRTSGVTDWDEIAQRLNDGERVQGFPQNAISGDPRTVPVIQAEQSARAAATLAERDAALTKAAYLESELSASREKNEALLREIGELRYQIGRLEAELESLKKGNQ